MATMLYRIERMQEEDLDEVVQIEEISGLNRWGYEAYRRELLWNPNAVMLVARSLDPQQRKVVGFLAGWVVTDELHINNIASHPQWRRRGIGRQLMELAILEGKARGANYALLEVRESNIAAQMLYRKLGFRVVARRHGYYNFPSEDALLMRLDL
jgi:ribosomal-protein-alanine N-acetyltransferase